VAPERSETPAEPPLTANLPSRGAFLGGVPSFRGPDGTGSQVLSPGELLEKVLCLGRPVVARVCSSHASRPVAEQRLPGDRANGGAALAVGRPLKAGVGRHRHLG
jgi:hypothetical protein